MAAVRPPIMNPIRPPPAPAAKKPAEIAKELLVKNNDNANDKGYMSGWTGQSFKTGTVFGKAETAKLIKDLKALPAAQQKAVVKALAAEIKKGETQGGMTQGNEFNSRIQLDAGSKKALDAFAKKVGANVTFPIVSIPVIMG